MSGRQYPVERQYRRAGNLGEAEDEAVTKIIDALPKGEAAKQGGRHCKRLREARENVADQNR